MSNLESLYVKLPVPLQQVACSLEGWRIRRSRYAPAFFNFLRDYEQRAGWSRDRITEYRDRRLREFVKHCAETVPCYRRRFAEAGIRPEDISTLADLGRLDILTKDEVKANAGAMESEAVPAREKSTAHTSGTTGGGLKFAVTQDSMREQWAVWWRYRRAHGIPLDALCGYFAGRTVVPPAQARPPFHRYNLPGRQILFSGYHMNDDNMRHYIKTLNRRRPPWLHGYPSLLALIAGFMADNHISLEYDIRWITTGAETLTRQQSALIESAFGVRPRQHYGMAEAVANISECEHGKLHVDEDFAAIEFIPLESGEGCRIIGTNFTNPAAPLLRYDTGDVAVLSEEGCSCGRPGRVVDSIDGRIEDYVVLAGGAKVGRLDHIFKDIVHIREAQIYQREPGAIIIRIVRGEGYTEATEKMLLDETSSRLGGDTTIEIKYVDAIERTASGKLRFVVSDIPGSRIDAT